MPLEWASIRSIARCVLPVLVGPSTAVTPAPRTRASREPFGDEKEMVIQCPEKCQQSDDGAACRFEGSRANAAGADATSGASHRRVPKCNGATRKTCRR